MELREGPNEKKSAVGKIGQCTGKYDPVMRSVEDRRGSKRRKKEGSYGKKTCQQQR